MNGRLENWSIGIKTAGTLQRPETKRILQGRIYDDPRFPNGCFISTSEIVGCIGEDIITHDHSIYKLGNILPTYEAAFPNARNRLLADLQKTMDIVKGVLNG